MDYPVKKGEKLTLEILRAGDAGDGVAQVQGLTIFVEKTLPGETVQAVITEVQPRFAKARAERILTASADRVQPPCPHEKRCGGCSMQFMRYERHCAALEEHVAGLMQRVGGQTDYERLPILCMDGGLRQAFLENARLLQETWGIVPLLYGSLGLEALTGEALQADDVDVLIPGEYLDVRWAEFVSVLAQQGYSMADEHEHEFEKNGVRYAYARIEELEPFAGIMLSEIAVVEAGALRFQLLTLPQYLKVYTASVKDGYRVNVRQKKDAEKIALIQAHLQKGTDPVTQPFTAGPWRYRNKAVFRAGGTKEQPMLGFVGKGTHDLVPATDCLLQTEEACAAARAVEQWMRDNRIAPYDERTKKGVLRHVVVRTNKRGQVMVVPVTAGEQLPAKQQLIAALKSALPGLVSVVQNINSRPGQQILGYKCRLLYGQERLEDELMGLRFRLSALSFYQINRVQTERLYQQALDFARLTGKETVVDAYCGAGTISLCMARQAARVIGVEIVPEAIYDAKDNAARNGVENAEFIAGACEDVLPRLVADGLRPDVVMLDPPRKGCEEAVLRAAAGTHPQRIVYVSCGPATLARDAKRLAGLGYQMKKLRMCDMFSWTGEAESVALFEPMG